MLADLSMMKILKKEWKALSLSLPPDFVLCCKNWVQDRVGAQWSFTFGVEMEIPVGAPV